MPECKNKIYTVGYSNISAPSRLLSLVENTHSLLVDTRYKPYSRRPQWSGTQLLKLVGEQRYLWIGATLGNLNYNNGGPIKLVNPEWGIAALSKRLEATNIILLCQCANVETCHRKVIAELLSEATGAEIEHLDNGFEMDSSSSSSITAESKKAIRALSLQQPWAWLVSNGHKLIENRAWSTNYRGTFLIHASKRFDTSWKVARSNELYLPPFVRELMTDGRLPTKLFYEQMPQKISDYQMGGIVGIATLTDCVSQSNDPWFFGKYGFTLTDVSPLPFVECNGSLGFFEVSDDVLAQGLALEMMESERKSNGQ